MNTLAQSHSPSRKATWRDLPAYLLRQLEQEGIFNARDWLRANPDRRESIFGVTRARKVELDRIAKHEGRLER